MTKFVHPRDPRMGEICGKLADLALDLDRKPRWPSEQLQICSDAGVMAWFVSEEFGGLGCRTGEIVDGLLSLGSACVTTTFILTQQISAYTRLAASVRRSLAESFLPAVATGNRSATVGISHLTTSRQYETRPVLRATTTADGYCLDGYSPWVTGAGYVDAIVTGAQLEDGRQILVFVPFTTPGVTCGDPVPLIALSGSCTSKVSFDRVDVPDEHVLSGPVERVIHVGSTGSTGGLQTSALALALASSACNYLASEARGRPELSGAAEQFHADLRQQVQLLRNLAEESSQGSPEKLRERSNSLVLRATQAALSAAKGAGFTQGHPVGRWCKESLFFLVWSCPPAVVDANLCELAGIHS